MRTVIALLTDFGSRDHYVAAVKAVILSRCRAELIDLSHDVPPHDAFAAGHFLRSVIGCFDTDSLRPIFVTVVDPGVGGSRRILAATEGGRIFLAPDNGILSLVLGDGAHVHSVERDSFFLPGHGSTFHGRDRFAPAAAALASGSTLGELGPAVDPRSLVTVPYQAPRYGEDKSHGLVVSVDHFGNLVTDLDAARLPPLRKCLVRIGGREITRWSISYEQPKGEVFFLVGSNGTLEVSCNAESAARVLEVGRFASVEVERV